MSAKKGTMKIFAFLLTFVFIFQISVMALAAKEEVNFIIGNPYETVNWDTWGSYKTQLHCQSNVSDGGVPLNEVIETHYRLDYDILAVTDHMTVGVEWNKVPKYAPVMRLVKYDRTKLAKVTPLTDERRQEIINGVGRDGRGMLEVTQGIELNGAVPSNSHLNGFFADYGQSLIGVDGDYETPIRKNGEAGGITFLDHCGSVTKAEEENNPELSRNPKFVNKFSRLFLDYKSLVGMDINSGACTDTLYDRILYDEILQKVIPYGRVPWSFTFSDAHSEGEYDRAFTVQVMSEKTVPALRTSMENGTFFGISRYPKIESGNMNIHCEGQYPIINRINVDQEDDTIEIVADERYYNSITWVSDGNIIATGSKIDLDELGDNVGMYVRAYLLGDGGICYVQPFTTHREGETLKQEIIPKTYDLSYFLRKLVTVINDIVPDWSPLRLIWWLLVGITDGI